MEIVQKEAQELDGLLRTVPDEMRIAMLTALLSIPRIEGLTCAIKPQGDFKALGIRKNNQWFAAISVNKGGLRGYFEPVANVDPLEIERLFSVPATRQDKVVSVPINAFEDMRSFLSVLKTTS